MSRSTTPIEACCELPTRCSAWVTAQLQLATRPAFVPDLHLDFVQVTVLLVRGHRRSPEDCQVFLNLREYDLHTLKTDNRQYESIQLIDLTKLCRKSQDNGWISTRNFLRD